jgi:glycosyltransferase involved in cell wall biosynthesis
VKTELQYSGVLSEGPTFSFPNPHFPAIHLSVAHDTRQLRIVQITPGAGKMYCGACLRDNALVSALRRLGHSAVMTPLYLPLTLDEADQSAGTPLFYGGISVFLEQHSALFRHSPQWLRHWLAAPALLKLAAGPATRTRPENLGPITLSMLCGEDGNQSRELDELIGWLAGEKPDVICLSNALLIGLARRLRSQLRVPVICTFQGEDWFLDALPSPAREEAWQTLAGRAADADLFIAPSRYFADLMQKRLQLPPDRVRVVFNGINLEGFSANRQSAIRDPKFPTLGFFARLCREKGLDKLVDAFLLLKKRDRVKNLKLRVGGSCGPADKIVVDELRGRLEKAGVAGDVDFVPNPSRAAKLEFFRTLSVFSVPAVYSEAFGLYLIEALATGVPVVQPAHSAFPEIVIATGGGLLCDPRDLNSLADALESLLLDPVRARALGEAGREAVAAKFNVETMARQIAVLCEEAIRPDALLQLFPVHGNRRIRILPFARLFDREDRRTPGGFSARPCRMRLQAAAAFRG